MDVVFLLVPLSLVLAFLIGGVFWWALKRGQFDDLEGPAHRILMDEDRADAGPPPEPNGGNRAGAQGRSP